MAPRIILRWVDANGEQHSREYDTNQTAEINKAKSWLLENGADAIDIAYRPSQKTNEPPKPYNERNEDD